MIECANFCRASRKIYHRYQQYVATNALVIIIHVNDVYVLLSHTCTSQGLPKNTVFHTSSEFPQQVVSS